MERVRHTQGPNAAPAVLEVAPDSVNRVLIAAEDDLPRSVEPGDVDAIVQQRLHLSLACLNGGHGTAAAASLHQAPAGADKGARRPPK
jgi:hypothetical protein